MSPSSSNAGSVEVQAPPGLEAMNGCRVPSPLMTPGSQSVESSVGPIAPPKSEGVKEDLVREITAAVQEHIESKTAAAVETLWQKGQRAMHDLQQRQFNQTQLLQSQLAACAEAQQQLQRENAMLRSGLEALMKHLTLVLGPPPSMPCVPPTPMASPPLSTPTTPAPMFSPGDVAATSQTTAPTVRSTTEGTEDFHTPAGSPIQGGTPVAERNAEDASTSPLAGIPGFPLGTSGCGGTGSQFQSPQPPARSPSMTNTPIMTNTSQSGELTFSLTLRRADNVPLGLEVQGDSGADHLVVESVKNGGAVEAWNRQCHGDAREIRSGDRILMINDAKDADSMREECKMKHLLKMSVVRGPPGRTSDRTPVGFRADADEFVPQAQPRA